MSNSLTRLFYNTDIVIDRQIAITDKEKIHHISTVLRIKSGEDILLFNGQDGEFLAEILSISKSSILIIPKRQTKSFHRKNKINIAAAIIKPERFRFLIEKCTEIGCTSFSPIITARTMIKKINNNKVESYIIGATEQCGRCDIPTITQEISLKLFLNNNTNQLIFCDEHQTSQMIQTLNLSNITPISILIGPEGGFTEEERELIIKHPNVHRVSLGENILRAETAAIAALTLVVSTSNK